MIKSVYKGVMKAVAKQLSDCISADMKCGDRHPFESYMMSAEAFAYEELCKAFHIDIHPVHVDGLEQVEEIARKVVNRMGQGRVENGEYIKDGAAETYVGIVMPNKIWKLTWSPLFMSSVSPRPEPSSHLLSPGRRMSSVLPDLDRMLPVLERMTKNLMYEATTGHVVRKKKNFMGRERKRNVPGK